VASLANTLEINDYLLRYGANVDISTAYVTRYLAHYVITWLHLQKPEVHNVVQYDQRRTDKRRTQNELWTCDFWNMRLDRQTYRHKDTLIAILCKQISTGWSKKVRPLPSLRLKAHIFCLRFQNVWTNFHDFGTLQRRFIQNTSVDSTTTTLLLQPFYGPWTLSGTIRVSRYQKGKTRKVKQSGFIGARESKWQWHQLGNMQICTSPQTDNHVRIPPFSFIQDGCKALNGELTSYCGTA